MCIRDRDVPTRRMARVSRTLLLLTVGILFTDQSVAFLFLSAKGLIGTFGNEFQHPDQPYVIIFCKIRKRDRDKFLSALSELDRKMILCGYPGYSEFCDTFIAKMNDGARALREKRCKPNEAHPIGETEQTCSKRAS